MAKSAHHILVAAAMPMTFIGPVALSATPSEGQDALILRNLEKTISRDWCSTSEVARRVVMGDTRITDEESDYIQPPPSTTYTVRVRYVNRGRGTPLPMDTEPEDDE